MSSLIELKDIHKSYWIGDKEEPVLKGINFNVEEGDLLSIVGASGSGKSTLMNIIGLLDSPTSGEYYLNSQEVSTLTDDQRALTRNRTIGFVFQSFFLLPRLTTLQNVCLPHLYRNTPAQESRDKAMEMLQKVSMDHLHKNRPNQLSGGQQQRVAIARALVGTPSLILADEPTGALDSKTGREVMDLFIQLNAEDRTTIVIITHDPAIADECKKVVRVADGHVVDVS